MRGNFGLERRGVQADRAFAYRNQFGIRVGIGRCEQGDVVTQIYQHVAQNCDHSLGTAIQLGRNGFASGAIWAMCMGRDCVKSA
jgi:hypothetical protein